MLTVSETTQDRIVGPSPEEFLLVIRAAEQVAAEAAAEEEKQGDGGSPAAAPTPGHSRVRGRSATACGAVGGGAARRGVTAIVDRGKVIEVARRVATRKTKGMTDGQVLKFIAENTGFRKSLAGHLHEYLDAEDLHNIYKLRQTLGQSEGRWLRLYAEHNRKGLDGAYKGAVKTGDALFAQHKLTSNAQQLRKAANKTAKTVRGKTELVVARGTKVDAATSKGLHGVRQTGRSVKGVRGMVDRAADPNKVRTGAAAARTVGLKAAGGAALAGAGVSVLLDVNKLRKGELTGAEVAENAAWAGGEAAVCTLASAAVTAAAAETIAAGVAALAGSALAGTTTAAAGLALLGPAGLGICVCIGVGFAAKRLRRWLRG